MNQELFAEWREIALLKPCLFAFETTLPGYAHLVENLRGATSLILTVNSGYEWLEEGYGGAVFHASVAARGRFDQAECQEMARRALAGAGNKLHEWEEWTGRAFHLRRRLTKAEQERVGVLRDLRQTEEGRERYFAALPFLSGPVQEFAWKEVNAAPTCVLIH